MDTRTQIAAMALQGLLSNPNQNIEVWDPGLTDVAVGYADDLIKHMGTTASDAPKPTQEAPQEEAEEPRETAPAAPPGVTPTLRDLGVSGRACAPLERMGVTTLAQLAVQSRDDIKQVRGVATSTLEQFDDLLSSNGLSWGMAELELSNEASSGNLVEEVPDDVEDEDDLL